jgi:hypothetical protein
MSGVMGISTFVVDVVTQLEKEAVRSIPSIYKS